MGAGQMKVKHIYLLAFLLILEIILRYHRIPFFPAWVVLPGGAPKNREFPFFSGKQLPFYSYSGLVILIELFFWGFRGLDLILALFLAGVLDGFLMERRLRYFRNIPRYFRYNLLALVLWSLFARFYGNYPAGSIELNILLAALLTRISGVEWLGGLLARILFINIFYGGVSFIHFLLFGLPGKKLRQSMPRLTRVVPFFLILFLASGVFCAEDAERSEKYFQVPRVGPDEKVEIHFDPGFREHVDRAKNPHPLLAAGERNNQTCLLCHRSKTKRSVKSRLKKSHHEIHYVFVSGFREKCVDCHTGAGLAGFPDLRGTGDRRSDYNKSCQKCHRRPVKEPSRGELYWKKKFWSGR